MIRKKPALHGGRVQKLRIANLSNSQSKSGFFYFGFKTLRDVNCRTSKRQILAFLKDLK